MKICMIILLSGLNCHLVNFKMPLSRASVLRNINHRMLLKEEISKRDFSPFVLGYQDLVKMCFAEHDKLQHSGAMPDL